MNTRDLAHQIEALHQRIEAFHERLDHHYPVLSDFTRQSHHPSSDVSSPRASEDLQIAIEELRVAEEELRQQNEELQITQRRLEFERQRYLELFEFAPDAYLVTDRNGMIQEANRGAAKLLGVPQEFLIRKPLVMFAAPEARSMLRLRLLHLPAPEQTQVWEMPFQPRSGEPFEAALTVAVSDDQQGAPASVRWLLRNITAQKQEQAEIVALNTELIERSIFDITLQRIGDAVRASLDEAHIVQTVVKELVLALDLVCCDSATYNIGNATATVRWQHTRPGQITPSQPGLVLMSAFSEGYQQLIDGQAFQFCEITPNPVRRQVAILACPIADHQDVLGDLWCFMPRDTALSPSEVRLVQQVANHCAIALRQARLYQAAQVQVHQLADLNRAKDDFLSTVSHELRTPLANIKMALHMLKVCKTEEQRSRYLQILQNECDREIKLVTDLLSLQHMEIDTYPDFLPEAVNLQDWLFTITAGFQQRLPPRQQTLTIQAPPALPTLVTDRDSLRRVLLELLINAHKYTPAGGAIELNVVLQAEGDRMVFQICNQAEIPSVELPQIFNKFYRVAQIDPWQAGGTGLGLALVKQLVDRLQGEISVTSQDGWTTFTVQLPLNPQPGSNDPHSS